MDMSWKLTLFRLGEKKAANEFIILSDTFVKDKPKYVDEEREKLRPESHKAFFDPNTDLLWWRKGRSVAEVANEFIDHVVEVYFIPLSS
jgi:hypothetical protein